MRLLTFVVCAAFLSPLAWVSPAGAQTARAAAGQTLAQAERVSVELKQGMTAEDVQKLLGKPRRTTLKNVGVPAAPGSASQGTLQWIYSWAGSSSPASLSIDFVSKAPEQWSVNSWEWATY